MRIFLYNFHQGGKYTEQLAIHQAELRREKTFTDQKYLSITSLQTEYLNLEGSTYSGRYNKIENIVNKNSLFVEVLTILQNFFLKG